MPAHLTLVSTNPWPPNMVGHLTLVHEDDRRAIYECNRGDFSIQRFQVKQRCALGNHYHIGKSETFTILSGGGFIVTRAVDANGVPCGKVFVTAVKPGDIIRIVPFMVHTFVLDVGSEMLNYSSAPFDEKNMDMTAHTLVDPRSLKMIVD